MNSLELLKLGEQEWVKSYIKYAHRFMPDFLSTGLDIPDCYFKFRNKHYAVEVTRYFQHHSVKERIIYLNYIEKLLTKDNFFKEVYNRLGKKKVENVTIIIYDLEELKQMIIKNIAFIKTVSIKNNYFFNNEKLTLYNVICNGSNKDTMSIEEFIAYIEKDIDIKNYLKLEIATKNQYSIPVSFMYCDIPIYGDFGNKKAIHLFCWEKDEEEACNNIIQAIENKNNKLIKEYIPKLRKNNIEYDYYNLLLCSERPASVDEEQLYNRILKIKNLTYNEIAIFLEHKLMIINKRGLKLYSTKTRLYY